MTPSGPDTRIAWSGEFAIAHQVLGSGARDLVYLPAWVSNVEANWDVPEIDRFLRRLAAFSRLIVLDRRGVGCSDRLPPGHPPTLEEIVDDVLAVMETANSVRTFLFGSQETGFATMLAAATHPDRIDGLILFGSAATWMRSDDHPWAWSQEQFDAQHATFRRLSNMTEAGEAYVRATLPSFAGDPGSARAIARLMAVSSGVGGGIAESERFARVDLRELLPSIRVPTLVLHRANDPVERIESGRYLAEHIPNATFVELPGNDGQPWAGETEPVLAAIEEFVTGSAPGAEPIRRLATVLFTDIVRSTERAAEIGDARWGELLAAHHERVRAALARFRGVEIDTAGDGFLATFDGPARAVECAGEIVDGVRELGVEVRVGCHTGELEYDPDDVHGIAVHIGARVMALAGASEILVSSTVKDLVAGSGLVFEAAGEHELKGIPERWRLYRLVR